MSFLTVVVSCKSLDDMFGALRCTWSGERALPSLVLSLGGYLMFENTPLPVERVPGLEVSLLPLLSLSLFSMQKQSFFASFNTTFTGRFRDCYSRAEIIHKFLPKISSTK